MLSFIVIIFKNHRLPIWGLDHHPFSYTYHDRDTHQTNTAAPGIQDLQESSPDDSKAQIQDPDIELSNFSTKLEKTIDDSLITVTYRAKSAGFVTLVDSTLYALSNELAESITDNC